MRGSVPVRGNSLLDYFYVGRSIVHLSNLKRARVAEMC